VHVGVDPDAALVFRGAGFTALLDLLDGSQPTSAVRRAARAAGLTAAQARGALDALASAGLLSERDTTPYAGSANSSAVRLIGAGPVGYQLARLLVASGLSALYVYDDEPTDLALYPAAGVLSSRSKHCDQHSPKRDHGLHAEPLVKTRGRRWISPSLPAISEPDE
jgi:hypothetical protein